MLPKLKLKASVPPASAGSPTLQTPSAGIIKLKLNNSQPPTPKIERSPSVTFDTIPQFDRRADAAPSGSKRAADDDIAPAPKRPVIKSKISLKIPSANRTKSSASTPASAGPLNKIKLNRKKSTGPKLTGLFASKGRPVPKRRPGEGYDSEDSEVEEDPAIQQGLILRMQPGDDATFLRTAINDGKIGVPKNEGGADVSIRFITSDFRRAVVRVRGHTYGAVLVDLPCIIESMKSWDRKGWWKVSDISQMLFVLGPCKNEDEAKSMSLPREIDRNTWQYAHGITPPMHWVRKRRFRKRADHTTLANVEEEVERLLREDEETERAGGTVELVDQDLNEREQSYDQSHYGEDDAEGEAYETVENDDSQYQDFTEMDIDPAIDGNLADDLQAAFDANFDDGADLTGTITQSPTSIVGPAPLSAENSNLEDTGTAAQTPAPDQSNVGTEDEEDDDDDDDDDEEDDDDADSIDDIVDEDAAERAAEKAQQLEEVADIEREIANVRAKASAMTNQLLRNREITKLQKLERELVLKREAFGLNADD